MTNSCSIVCFRSPVTGDSLSLSGWTALLRRKDMTDSFVETTDVIGPLLLNETRILSYLQMNNKRKEELFQKSPFSLQRDLLSSELNLLSALIEHMGKSNQYPEEFTEILTLTCLAIFSSDNMLPSFLIGCISSTCGKVSALILTDITAHWTLKGGSSMLCMSTSLLKKKLKDEGTTFSIIILNALMQTAKNLLTFKSIVSLNLQKNVASLIHPILSKYSGSILAFHPLSISIIINGDII